MLCSVFVGMFASVVSTLVYCCGASVSFSVSLSTKVRFSERFWISEKFIGVMFIGVNGIGVMLNGRGFITCGRGVRLAIITGLGVMLTASYGRGTGIDGVKFEST
ncbi:Uncharacterised protein [uncultured archaeon]|nr:Uncharacterised protein [uncultured archaeon]